MSMDNLIKIAYNVLDLTGEGLEYLVVNGEVIGKFFNGNLMGVAPVGNTEVTRKAA